MRTALEFCWWYIHPSKCCEDDCFSQDALHVYSQKCVGHDFWISAFHLTISTICSHFLIRSPTYTTALQILSVTRQWFYLDRSSFLKFVSTAFCCPITIKTRRIQLTVNWHCLNYIMFRKNGSGCYLPLAWHKFDRAQRYRSLNMQQYLAITAESDAGLRDFDIGKFALFTRSRKVFAWSSLAAPHEIDISNVYALRGKLSVYIERESSRHHSILSRPPFTLSGYPFVVEVIFWDVNIVINENCSEQYLIRLYYDCHEGIDNFNSLDHLKLFKN